MVYIKLSERWFFLVGTISWKQSVVRGRDNKIKRIKIQQKITNSFSNFSLLRIGCVSTSSLLVSFKEKVDVSFTFMYNPFFQQLNIYRSIYKGNVASHLEQKLKARLCGAFSISICVIVKEAEQGKKAWLKNCKLRKRKERNVLHYLKEKLCTISHRTACNQTKPFRVNFAFYEAILLKKKSWFLTKNWIELYRDTNLGVVILEYIYKHEYKSHFHTERISLIRQNGTKICE